MIISSQKGRGSKIHISADGEYKITTTVDFWLENFIKDGTELDEEEWEELCRKINFRKALSKCYDYLSRRDHSQFELKQKLSTSFDETVVNDVIEHVKKYGYIDDKRFAENYADLLINKKHFSNFRIKQELSKKGIERTIIDEVLSEIDVDPVDSILQLLSKKYASKLNNEKGIERTKNALLRLGYSYSDIRSAFNLYYENKTNCEDDDFAV